MPTRARGKAAFPGLFRSWAPFPSRIQEWLLGELLSKLSDFWAGLAFCGCLLILTLGAFPRPLHAGDIEDCLQPQIQDLLKGQEEFYYEFSRRYIKRHVWAPAKIDKSQSFSLTLAHEAVPAALRGPLEAFLGDAAKALPPSLKERLRVPIQVRFIDSLDKGTRLTPPQCYRDSGASGGESPVWGATLNASPPTIFLNSKLIPEIVKGEEGAIQYPCGHHNLYRLAKATLLHEISHAYDFSKLGKNPGKFSVSDDSLFLNLLGWNASGLLLTGREQHNFAYERSPDPYEFENPRESFAVNMEFFLTDPEFSCRRPSLHAFLSRHFAHDPFPDRKCGVNYAVPVVNNSEKEQNAVQWRTLDKSRLYSVEYLQADPGSDASSAWGHAMFRLVFCSPERKSVDEKCLLDTDQHVVISFRAGGTEMGFDPASAFSGKYPSQMYFFPFSQIRNEYNVGQFRDLRSMPLKLSQEEKSSFIDRTVESFWDYRGKYYFLSNNCAAESLHLLQGVVDNPGLQEKSIVTPNGLAKALAGAGLVDPYLTSDRDEAIEKGLFFPSATADLKRSYNFVRRLQMNAGAKPFRDLRSFSESSLPAERKAAFAWLVERAPAEQRRTLAAHFYLLESFFENHVGQRLMSEGNEEIVKHPGRIGLTFADSEIIRNVFSRQANAGSTEKELAGYGIPLDRGKNENASSLDTNLPNDVRERLNALLRKRFAKEVSQLGAIQENKLEYLRFMKK